MANSDDELARTATAHDGAPTPDPERPIGEMIGRYRLERELGQGGMGVVFVAFDPDLERRVALKVLRATTSTEAAQRLQREARAMARLNHPNVVTVHEVGTANGRDYVAMELIEGETLADWLRSQKRSEPDVVDAFVQAGRGLAAAHAAGIVHRDFKPHNVLRASSGRIEVTDFGLAREAHAEAIATDPLVATLPVGLATTTTGSKTPSSLSGLTVTGSLLGTPAYMAPEQWTAGVVSPATDQFAFSVALWEALAGERPYREPTVEGLRAQILEGPTDLDVSKIPRRLRRVLLRGLDPDPKKRWPSMAAMLLVIEKRGRTSALFLAGGGAAVIAGGAIALALGMRGSSEPPCAPPALAPSTVWSERARTVLLDAGHTAAVKLLDADFGRWASARSLVCAAPVERRAPALACLDGVLQQMNAAVRAAEQLRDVPPIEIGIVLIDPNVCGTERPPRLLAPSPQMREVIEVRLREDAVAGSADPRAMKSLVERVASDPCASSYAHAMQAFTVRESAEQRRLTELAETEGERCEDERVRADAALHGVLAAVRMEFLAASIPKKLRHAEVAVQRVTQPDLVAMLDVVRMNVAARAENLEVALQRADAALAGFAMRGRYASMVEAGLSGLSILQARATPADLAEVARRIANWREVATKQLGPTHDVLRRIEQVDAWWSFMRGDVAGAHSRLAAARREEPIEDARRAHGRVVDVDGKPVAGATVVSGKGMVGDSISIAIADPDGSSSMRTTTTASDGTFTIADVPSDGVVIAQLGAHRSLAFAPGEALEIRLRATSRIEGKVELHGLPRERVIVAIVSDEQARAQRYSIVAPVSADGSFEIDGAPRGKVKIIVQVSGVTGVTSSVVERAIDGGSVNIALVAPHANRVVHVIVRSAIGLPVPNAQVIVRPGAFSTTNAKGLTERLDATTARLARPIVGETAPQLVREVARPDDLYATMSEVPDGIASACALALPADLTDPDLQPKIDNNLEKIEVRCTAIDPDSTVVTIEVPPWPRLD
ncbi:MAG: protein kinase domain-containing protein [Kofleriaceae bacterium]